MPRVGQISKDTGQLSHHEGQSVHAKDTTTQPEAATATQSVPNFRGMKDFKSDNVKNTTATSTLVNLKI